MKPFTHIDAGSVREAVNLLTKYRGRAKLNAGGTDLLGVLKEGSLPQYPEVIINMKTIAGLDYIREDEAELKIGALARLRDISCQPAVMERYKLLSEAAKSVATPAIRNACTVGGNLAQDVRCWYYRYPRQLGGPIECMRKGGKICNALAGDNRYHSIFGAAPLAVYPCSSHCPAGTDIPAYLREVRKGDRMEAARLLLDFNPLPAVTGRVCPIFCEPECNRSAFDEPVAIRCVERSMGDYILEKAKDLFKAPEAESGKTVAVLGSGPAGLTAAYYLRRTGHSVTVFERLPEAGGMLLYSIPAYRLPKDVVRRQIEALKGMGIKFEVGVDVGKHVTIPQLMDRFDAVFLAFGAWKERPLGIKGEKYALSGLEFLNRVSTGARDVPGKKVAVVGGGNVAMDVARTLLRLGALPVVLYRRGREEMPAFRDEVDKAQEEGIAFKFLTLPTAASKVKDRIDLTCVRMKLGAPDASGRRQPVPIPGSESTLAFDAVIKAIGEEQDTSVLPSEFRKRRPKGEAPALLLGKNLFAGGDFVSGPSTVIEAVASGREGARLVGLMFGDAQPEAASGRSEPDFTSPYFEAAARVQVRALPVSERVGSTDVEDTPSLRGSDIETEARRCFECGCMAVNPSDVGTALVALDARIVTTKRTVDALTFFTASATEATLLDADEVISEVQVPEPPQGARQNYVKFTLRKPIDFAMVSVASVVTVKNGVCTDARIVLGGVAPTPVRAMAAEDAIKGRPIDEAAAAEAAAAALAGARPLSMNGYKIEIAKTLVKKALLG